MRKGENRSKGSYKCPIYVTFDLDLGQRKSAERRQTLERLCQLLSKPPAPFNTALVQARRHGGHSGPCPPKWQLVPPKRKLCPPQARTVPRKNNSLGATGVQIETQIGVCQRYFHNFCGLTPDFMTFLGWRPFFLEITCFRPEKVLKFLISAGKSLWIFGLHLVHLIQTRINFSCPRAPLEFTKINFSCPPQKIYFCPPSHATLAPGLLWSLLINFKQWFLAQCAFLCDKLTILINGLMQ